MPAAAEVLASSEAIAKEAFAVAVVWHAVVAFVLWRLALGARPSRRAAAVLVALPLVSVSAVAFAFGNPFNGVVCGALAVALTIIGARLDDTRVRGGPGWAVIAGTLMMALGWAYPEFVGSPSAWRYLVGAPFGLLPCPTLSFLVGASLLGSGFGSRAWSLVAAAAGLLYGLAGAFWLHVRIDLVLAAGSLLLAVVAIVACPSDAPQQAGRASQTPEHAGAHSV